MNVNIDWATKIITVPKAELTIVQVTPTEVYSMELNAFRAALKDKEDDSEGMPFLDTHSHNTEVLLGGITYARVLEIINGYTVTFEDGQYAVNLIGANSNVGDNVNVNQVSVRTANSAGLISSAAIEYSSYGGAIHIDVINGTSGVLFPQGTAQAPVNNLTDAILLAESRGFEIFHFVGNFTFDATVALDGYEIYGQSEVKTIFTFTAGSRFDNCEFFDCEMTGTIFGFISATRCDLHDLEESNIQESTHTILLSECLINGFVRFPSNYNGTLKILDSYSDVPGSDTPIIDLGDNDGDLLIRNWSGGLELENVIHANHLISIDLNSGQLIVGPTCTGGLLSVRGIGSLTDTSGAGFIVNSAALLNLESISSAVVGTTEIQSTLAYGRKASDNAQEANLKL